MEINYDVLSFFELPSNTQCAPHLVYTSLLFQLFLLGLFISLLMLKNKTAGISLAIISLAVAVNRFLQNTKTLESPVIFDVNFSPSNTLEYFKLVHFSLSSQLVPYVIGIFAASIINEKTRGSKVEVLLSSLAMTACLFAPLLHNKYHVISPENYSFFVLAVKVVSALACVSIARVWSMSSTKSSSENDQQEPQHEETKEDLTSLTTETIKAVLSEDRVVSFSKAFVKLSLSMFMVSMFYIRLDYFSSRLLFSVSAYDAVSIQSLIKSLCSVSLLPLNPSILFFLISKHRPRG